MSSQQHIQSFVIATQKSLDEQSFIKVSLANYKGDEPDLKQILLKKVIIRDVDMLSFTYRYKTRDTIKNFSIKVGLQMIGNFLQSGFQAATLLCTDFDLQFQTLITNKTILRKREAARQGTTDTGHDKKKLRHLQVSDMKYLHDLGITSSAGVVYKDAQGKFKQINHYIELLRSMLVNLPKYDTLNVFDMGSGKGYLTFALYDYLTNNLGLHATVSGIEYRADLVQLCNEMADKNNFSNLQFIQGSIEEFSLHKCNVLIALHACDTATDDAIIKGIQAEADLIVVAPCCHKQIRKEMEKASAPTVLDSIIKHGVYMERQAEMITDSLRALVLTQYGYKVKVFDFIASTHTPKNIMITAERIKVKNDVINESKNKISALQELFGIQSFYLQDKLK